MKDSWTNLSNFTIKTPGPVKELSTNDLVNSTINSSVNSTINSTINSSINSQINEIESVPNLPIDLRELFKDFKFQDIENTVGFLDLNTEEIIHKQIENFLLSLNLKYENLILNQLKRNSVSLIAGPNSRYVGEVTLTWNLKIAEIWGLGVSSIDENVTNGLKGYIYLENGTNKIKYFDFIGNKTKSISQMHPYYGEYITIKFLNIDTDESKNFTIKGKYWTNQLERYFGFFDFDNELEVSISIQHPDKVKIFNAEENIWESITENIDNKYTLNFLGQIEETTW